MDPDVDASVDDLLLRLREARERTRLLLSIRVRGCHLKVQLIGAKKKAQHMRNGAANRGMARGVLRKIRRVDLAQVAVAHASAGSKAGALQIVRQLRRFSSDRYVSPYGLVQIYSALNDKEQTYKSLQTAYEDHSVWMSYLAVDPVFDRFRSDPRFHDLLRRLALLS